MASFKKTREKLQRLVNKHRQLLQRHYLIRQELDLATDEAEHAQGKLRSSLSRKQSRLATQITAATDKLKQADAELAATRQEFESLGEPQDLVEHLDDGVPFLLMPLKIETRFVTVKHVTRNFDRSDVFDTSPLNVTLHPPMPANGASIEIPELASLDAKGHQTAARKIRDRIESGGFVAPKGQWLPRIRDRKELWVRIFPDDIFVTDHEPGLIATELDAGRSYWRAIWDAEKTFRQAKEDQSKQAQINRNSQRLQAWARLQQRYQAARSKWVIQATQPNNFRGNQTDYLQPPEFGEVPVKAATWTRAPTAFTLPERFVVRLYSGESFREINGKAVDHGLVLGLDPESGELADAGSALPEKLRWLSDFEVAEAMGMALRIALSAQDFSGGFDRLVVLGTVLSADENNGQTLLEELFYNHQYRPAGLSILPQGTPTNTIERKQSAETEEEQEKQAYRRWSESSSFSQDTRRDRRLDGQRLAAALGIDDEVFWRVLNSDREDVGEALAMNRLLWPATMGYFLRQFLSPLINENTLGDTREFFTDFVSGRGMLPCLRVGDQPYGVLPTTAFSRLHYPQPTPQNQFYQALYERILKNLDRHWQSMISGVIHVADPITHGDRFDNRLMQLLGLHASSVDFYVRTMVDPFFAEDVMPVSVDNAMEDDYWRIMHGLREMGFHFDVFEEPTRIFDMLYSHEVRPLDGPLTDSLPLSEKRKLQSLPDSEDSYLDWLANGDVLQNLKPETISLDNNDGWPLLYLLLRHAVIRETINTAMAVLKEKGIVSPVADIDQEREEIDGLGANHEYVLRTAIQLKWQFAVMDTVDRLYREMIDKGIDSRSIAAFEESVLSAFDFFVASDYIRETVVEAVGKLRQRLVPRPTPAQQRAALGDFVQDVKEAIQIAVDKEFKITTDGLQTVHPDKWKVLSERFPEVSGRQTMLEWMNDQLKSSSPPLALNQLIEMKTAFEKIKNLPTARLERLLVEHIDCCNYRLDAWMLGLVNQRLRQQRKQKSNGIYLGAYGYLEDVRQGLVAGASVDEIVTPERMNFDSNKLVLNEICVPVLNLKALSSQSSETDRIIKNAFVYLGGQANTLLEYDANNDRIAAKPRTDDQGEGFLHTPSTAHANTAAILRSGYATYNRDAATPSPTDPLAVNLTSHRVRTALYYLDGIRNGQELGALLGYQFERALHDYADKKPLNTSFVSSVPGYLLELRMHFPLQTLKREDQVTSNDTVFSVVDGRALLNRFQQHQTKTHWSLGILTNCPPAHRLIVDEELRRLEASLDALSDLLMAESVYQMVKGNPERSAAAMRALNEGRRIDTPEIIHTPRRGFSYLQRLGIALSGGSDKPSAWKTGASPRALINPQINQWLSRQLPSPSRIMVTVRLADEQRLKWPLSKSDFQPIDLVYLGHDKDSSVQNGELILRIKEQIRTQKSLSSDVLMRVDFRDRSGFTDNQFSFFELLPLFETLATLLQLARPMFPEDLVVPSETARATNHGEIVVDQLAQGLDQVLADSGDFSLGARVQELQNLQQALEDTRGQESEPIAQGYDQLYGSLLGIAFYGIKEAVPTVDRQYSSANNTALSLQTANVVRQTQKKLRPPVHSLKI